MIRKKELLLAATFALSTLFFVWQHSFVSWDFASYASNAEYWNGGSYYEISRPPLVPFMLYALGASPISEYIFIILASVLFLYSTIRLADRMKIGREIFYIFSLSPMVLFYGMINGAELLSLALLGLFLVYLLEKSPKAGLFLGLACLARYNFLVFLPLVFSNRHPRKILAALALFAIPAILWLAFNFLTTGNMLTSLADSYALNFKYRHYFTQPASIVHILTAISFLLPLFVAGLYKTISEWRIKETKTMKFLCREKASVLLIIIFAMSIYQYVSTPSKELRYLFPIALPVAYFSSIGAKWIGRKRLGAIVVIAIMTLNLGYFLSMNGGYESRGKYQNSIDILRQNNLDNCRLLTNAWPIMSYLGQPSEPFPRRELVGKSVEEGDIIVLFPSIAEPEWAQNRTFVREFPVIYESDDLIMLGNGCNAPRRYEHNYMLLLSEKISRAYNISINTNPCFVMFSSSSILEKSCNFANGKGFILDDNRVAGLELVRD